MQQANQRKQYDIAKGRLALMIGHYAQLISDEYKKQSPDLDKINDWESAQEELEFTDSMLSVDDAEEIKKVNVSYEENFVTVDHRE